MLCAGLPSSVRSRSGQPCSLCRAGDLRVLRPTRRIPIRRRGRVLHNSPPPASVRSAAARHSGFALGYPLATLGPHFVRRLPDRDRAWHLWSSSSRNIAPRPRSPSLPLRVGQRTALTTDKRRLPRSPRRLSRRLHGVTRRNASSAGYRLLALRRVPPRIRRTEPSRVVQLATRHAAPLPHHMLNPFKPSQQTLTDI